MSVMESGASVQTPRSDPSFETQWKNLALFVSQLAKTAVLPGAVVVTNPNATPTSPTVPVAVTPPDGASPGLDPLTGLPLPGTPPVILQQGVLPVTDLVATPGAYMQDVYADISWETSPYSNAIGYEVMWGIVQADGTVRITGQQRISGDSLRLNNLLPNTSYGVQVIASNVIGQAMSTPSNGFLIFETTVDATIPPPVSENGSVILAAGATSVIVTFPALTQEQAEDVANGSGIYLVQLTNDPTWTNITRQSEGSSTVVSFNGIYPHTTLVNALSASTGAGTTETFQDLSMMPVGQQWTALIDDEFIVFNAPVGNTAVIAQRNAGLSPLTNGPESHVAGASVTLKTQTQWYARVAPIDASGNQGAWSYSSGMQAGGVTDSMIVGDLSASHITFGLLQGNLIEANTIQAGAISSGTISSANIVLNGGQLVAGNPPSTGLVMNSQGLTLYSGGVQTVSLNALTGQASFTGAINATSGTFSGNLSGAGGTFSGNLSGAGGTFSGDLSGAGGTFSGALSAASGSFSGAISGGTITGTTITVGGTYSGGTLQSDSGVANGRILMSGGCLYFVDSNNITRMSMGYQFGGYYNFVWSPDNTIVSEILPTSTQFTSGSGSVASTSPSYPAGYTLPSVKAYIGSSQDAIISITANMNPSGTSGTVWLVVDGVIETGGFVGYVSNYQTFCVVFSLKEFLSSMGQSVSANSDHTFSMTFATNDGSRMYVGNAGMTVQPI